MPALIKYDRKPLTAHQLYALREYIGRNRRKEQNSDVSVVESVSENDIKQEFSLEVEPEAIVKIAADSPAAPSAQELREQREAALKDVHEQLKKLEHVLNGLKRNKHELFEEFKSLLSSENESKKQTVGVERERQIHGFPSPFMGQLTGQGTLMSPYRQVVAGGIKRPKSPSPPLVQLYSPSCPSSTLQPLYDMPLAHPATTAGTATFPGQGDTPRLPFQQMGNKLSGHPDNMLQGYVQLQQNTSLRDPRQQTHTSLGNPHPSSSQAAGNNYVLQDRQFMETRHLQDRHLSSSFASPQNSELGISGRDMATQNHPRQALMNHPAFLQQNVLPGQQQALTNVSDGGFTGVGSFRKECPGFTNPSSHRPHEGYAKRGSHLPNRSSRYY